MVACPWLWASQIPVQALGHHLYRLVRRRTRCPSCASCIRSQLAHCCVSLLHHISNLPRQTSPSHAITYSLSQPCHPYLLTITTTTTTTTTATLSRHCLQHTQTTTAMDSHSFDYWMAQGNYVVPPHQTTVFDMPPELSKVPSLSGSPVSS